MRRIIPGLLIAFVLICLAGCRDKQPYPGAEQVRQNLVMQMKTPDVGQTQEQQKEPEPVQMVLALVRSVKGTTVVTGRADGGNLAVRHLPGHAWALQDGTLRVIRPEVRPCRQVTRKKRSVMAGLVMDEYAAGSSVARKVDLTPGLTAGWSETDEVVAEAIKADPDMAGEFYHVEQVRAIGSSGRWATWMLTVESYLGGAHPVEERRLIVVDMEGGRVVEPLSMFGDRDLPLEILKDRFDAACVRKLSGVVPFEGTGGEPLWAVLLTAEFGVCEGQWEMAVVPAPPGDERQLQTAFVLTGQELSRTDGGHVARGVLDFRSSSDGRAVIMEMAMGARDQKRMPWSNGREREDRIRETRFMVPGMDHEAVLARLPGVHSVQFLLGQPAGLELMKTFSGMSF